MLFVFVFQDGSRADAPPVFDCKRDDYVRLGGRLYQVMGRLHSVTDSAVITEIHVAEAEMTIGLWTFPIDS